MSYKLYNNKIQFNYLKIKKIKYFCMFFIDYNNFENL